MTIPAQAQVKTAPAAPSVLGNDESHGADSGKTKRVNYLEWQEYFMSIAFLSAQRSKDPRTQVGACIVNQNNKVVGIGYNGMPIGCKDDDMPWNRAEDASEEKWLQSKSPYVCHAELNAVLNKNLADVRGCSIYVALFPCNLCAQIIIQSGIKEVVYYSDKYHASKEFQASRHLMNMANVSYRQFCPRQETVTIEFGLIEKTVSEVPTSPKQSSFIGEQSGSQGQGGPDVVAPANGWLIVDGDNTQDQTLCSEMEENRGLPSTMPERASPCSKRQNYLEWEEYFMSMAFLSAQRSKDPRTQVGACIVNSENKVVGIGYNGMPIGCKDDDMPWNRAEDASKEKWLQSKSPYVCHAELNAVLNKNLADISGCSIYVALFPCNMCAQIIIQSGIKEVVYYSDKYHDKAEFQASRHLMNMAGVKFRQFRPRQKKIIIDFGVIERTESTNASNSNDASHIKEADARNREPITTQDSSNPATTNNNNICMKRKFSGLGRSVVERNLHHHLNEMEFVEPASMATNEEELSGMEFKFALVSWLFIILLAALTWFLSLNGDLVV